MAKAMLVVVLCPRLELVQATVGRPARELAVERGADAAPPVPLENGDHDEGKLGSCAEDGGHARAGRTAVDGGDEIDVRGRPQLPGANLVEGHGVVRPDLVVDREGELLRRDGRAGSNLDHAGPH